jgi:hypothetical protein
MPELKPAGIHAAEPEAKPPEAAPSTEPSAVGQWKFAHVLLFTGHMIDKADRKEPRFPAWAEGRARTAIHDAAAAISWTRPGPTIGLAAAASGGDLLFLEACAELGIPTRMMLALPVKEFLTESVAPAGPDWVRRFNAIVERHSPESLRIMGKRDGLMQGETANIWLRANLWMIEEAVELAPERCLLALWDGKAGDGPGGTDHLVQAALKLGFRVAPPISMQMVLRS